MALNVLIVDDSATLRAVLAKILRIAGVPLGQVYEAANGQNALELLQRHEVQLVFTDLNMPVLSGAGLVAAMRANEALAAIPVIMLSSDGSAARLAQCKAQGLSAYVRKPFTPEAIYKAVRAAVRI